MYLFLLLIFQLRKAAHTAVKVVLRGSLFMLQTPSPPFHPAARLTAQFCEKQIEAYKGIHQLSF